MPLMETPRAKNLNLIFLGAKAPLEPLDVKVKREIQTQKVRK